MQRILNVLNDEEKPKQLQQVNVSISYGIIEFKPSREIDIQAVLKQLDELMYEHKKRFKNKRT
ncbi:diguanylate cyclase domain-containing protein [Pseudothermotoga thermarum]|uniref:diguanylate cyclase domain-containing protein n=1 Tax=Pseudothermotoga thermarum TaxID=119394 RepID=UPI0002F17DE3|nr:diguanylate cyclase [Pseudothermotoga thermarum]